MRRRTVTRCGARWRASPPLGCTPRVGPAWPKGRGCDAWLGGTLPPTPNTPRGSARTRTGFCRATALRPPPPWPVDFAFRALGRAGSGRAGAQGVGVRVWAPGLGAPSSSSWQLLIRPPPLAALRPSWARAAPAFTLGACPRAALRLPQPHASPAPARRAGKTTNPSRPRAASAEAGGAARPDACAVRPPEPASTTPPGGTEGRQKHPRH